LRSVSASRERRLGTSQLKLAIRPLTPDRWPALEDLFGPNGACNGCWCMYWRIGSAYRTRSRAHNKAAFRANREARSATGLARLRRRHGRGLVSAYRRRGVTSARTAAAMKAAGRAKAPALEAHPLDADLTPSASSTGYASTFARAGFKTVARRVPPRPIMRHDLGAMSRGYGGVLRSRRDRDNSARASARSSRE